MKEIHRHDVARAIWKQLAVTPDRELESLATRVAAGEYDDDLYRAVYEARRVAYSAGGGAEPDRELARLVAAASASGPEPRA